MENVLPWLGSQDRDVEKPKGRHKKKTLPAITQRYEN